jgi:hypothetical protein
MNVCILGLVGNPVSSYTSSQFVNMLGHPQIQLLRRALCMVVLFSFFSERLQ